MANAKPSRLDDTAQADVTGPQATPPSPTVDNTADLLKIIADLQAKLVAIQSQPQTVIAMTAKDRMEQILAERSVVSAGYVRRDGGVWYDEVYSNGDVHSKRVDDRDGRLPKGLVVR